ncbi:MAG: hypothetical protein WKG03_12860, partial [Telluria sp.]
MVAIVSGNGAGLLNASAGTLGQNGIFGTAAGGNSKEAAYVNIANGNLSLQDQDDFIASLGANVALTRTYNSQGGFNDGMGAEWKLGVRKQVTGVTGAVNTPGSTVTRIDGDGSGSLYTFDVARNLYVTTDGGGAYQAMAYNHVDNTWTWRADRNDLAGVCETYSGTTGQIWSTRDQTGTRLTYTYADNQLVRIHDASGDDTYFDFTAGKLSRIRTRLTGTSTDFSRVSYGYDAQNRLQTVTTDLTPTVSSDASTYVNTYTYAGASNNIESVTQSDGSQLVFAYQLHNGKSKVTSVTDALGRQTQFDYSVTGKTTVTDPLGYKSAYVYDTHGQLLSVTSPAVNGTGAVTRFEYDASGNVSRTTDARGLTTDFGYDVYGNRTLERDAAGNTITRAYAFPSNKLIKESRYVDIDPDGAGAAVPTNALTTRYAYDSANRLRFVISTQGRVQEFQYNAEGQLAVSLAYINSAVGDAGPDSEYTFTAMVAWAATAMVKSSSVSRIDYGYDARGLVNKTTTYGATAGAAAAPVADATVSVVRHTYDHAGQLVQSIDANGAVVKSSYDGLGRVLTTTDALDSVSINTYDDASNRIVTKLVNGLSTASVFDKAGRLLTVTQTGTSAEVLGTTRYEYDANGRLRTIIDPRGQSQYFVYDEAGRKTVEIDADGFPTCFTYDAAGNQTSATRYATRLGKNGAPALGAPTKGIGDNQLLDPTFTNIFESGSPWAVANYLATPHTNSTDLMPYWQLSDNKVFGEETYYLSTLGEVVGSYSDTGQRIAVEAGKAYCMSAYVGAHRASVSAHIIWYDASGRALSWTAEPPESIDANHEKVGGAAIESYKRIYAIGNAPAGAAFASAVLRKGSTYAGSGNSYLFATRAQFEQVAPGATGPSIWKPTIIAAAGDQTTVNAYDAAGRLSKSVDALGNVTQFDYDGASRLVRTTQFATPVATATLGKSPAPSAINPASSLDDRVSRNFYDKDGKLQATLDAAGTMRHSYYDAAGRVTHTVQYATKVVGDLVNGTLGALAPAESAQDQRERMYYDGQGRMTSKVDGEGYLTSYTYDAAGNQTSATRYATPLGKNGLAAVGPTSRGIGDNQLLDPTFTNKNEVGSAWGHSNYKGDPAGYGTEHSPWWRVGENKVFGEETYYLVSLGSTGGGYNDTVQRIGNIEVGKNYCLSAYVGAHRATVSAHILWLDVNGGAISATWGGAPDSFDANHEKVGGPTIEGYKRIYAIGTAPAGAVACQVILRKGDTYAGDAHSYLFATRAQFEEVAAGATGPSSWKPTAVTSANDQVTYATYTKLNQVETETAADGMVTKYTYDKVGNRLSSTRAAGTSEAHTQQVRYSV